MKLEHDITIKASKSSGPGGQNVNKSNTKIEVRFCIHAATCLTVHQKDLLRRWVLKFRPSLYAESQDSIVITTDNFRSQAQNRAAAIRKLRQIMTLALSPPKKRIKTSTPGKERWKRQSDKRKRSEKKLLRRSVVGRHKIEFKALK